MIHDLSGLELSRVYFIATFSFVMYIVWHIVRSFIFMGIG